MGEFIAGMCVGCVLTQLVVAWFLFSKRSPIFATERSWMENADRWEWLRQYELNERANTEKGGTDGMG